MVSGVEIFPREKENVFILTYQYHVCWWPGNTRSWGISIHVIDISSHDIPDSALQVI